MAKLAQKHNDTYYKSMPQKLCFTGERVSPNKIKRKAGILSLQGHSLKKDSYRNTATKCINMPGNKDQLIIFN